MPSKSKLRRKKREAKQKESKKQQVEKEQVEKKDYQEWSKRACADFETKCRPLITQFNAKMEQHAWSDHWNGKKSIASEIIDETQALSSKVWNAFDDWETFWSDEKDALSKEVPGSEQKDKVDRTWKNAKETCSGWEFVIRKWSRQYFDTVTYPILNRINACFLRDNTIPSDTHFSPTFFLADFDRPPMDSKMHASALKALEKKYGKDFHTWDTHKEFDRLIAFYKKIGYHCGYLKSFQSLNPDIKIYQDDYQPPKDRELEPNDFRLLEGFKPVPQMPVEMFELTQKFDRLEKKVLDEALEKVRAHNPSSVELAELFLDSSKKEEFEKGLKSYTDHFCKIIEPLFFE